MGLIESFFFFNSTVWFLSIKSKSVLTSGSGWEDSNLPFVNQEDIYLGSRIRLRPHFRPTLQYTGKCKQSSCIVHASPVSLNSDVFTDMQRQCDGSTLLISRYGCNWKSRQKCRNEYPSMMHHTMLKYTCDISTGVLILLETYGAVCGTY